MKIWIDTDEFYPVYVDRADGNTLSYGPVEISDELYERIQECWREWGVVQSILETLTYEWQYPNDDGADCD